MSVAAAFAAGRKTVERTLLRHTCRIRANVETTDLDKGHIQTWPAVTATVVCQVQAQRPAIARGETIDDAMLPRPHAVSLPWDTVIAAPYHIEWVEGGVTLEVIGEPLEPGTDGLIATVNAVEWTAP